MLMSKINSGKIKHSIPLKIPKYQHLKKQELINRNNFVAPTDIIQNLPIAATINHDILWKPTHDLVLKNINTDNETTANKETTADNETTTTVEEDENIKNTNKLGFIILRNVNNTITNEYWKECFRCIRRFYPNNRILIIDDNSNKQFVTNEVLNNTMIIESEFPKRGEFLPYYYYLRTKFCEKVVIFHDSMYIKRYINFDGFVNDYSFLIHFGVIHINDRECYPSQLKLLRALNNQKLNIFYNKKEEGLWNGCFGSTSVITYDFLKQVDDEFHLTQLIPVITKRVDRCAFERIIGCMLQFKCKKPSLLGHINTNCQWGLNFNNYKKNMYDPKKPIVKVFSGR